MREPDQDARLRDQFAAAALTGLLAAPTDKDRSMDYWARLAFEAADAMLRKRGNQPKPPDSSTLTGAEREAVERAADWLDRWQQTHGYHSSESGDLATLRGLLERLK